jgi:tRNA uridine 5-carbamoylmethylation protein Kti12
MTGPTDELLQRNSRRSHPVPPSSLLKIASTLQPPLSTNNYFETPVLTLHCDATPLDNALVVADWLPGCWKVNFAPKCARPALVGGVIASFVVFIAAGP